MNIPTLSGPLLVREHTVHFNSCMLYKLQHMERTQDCLTPLCEVTARTCYNHRCVCRFRSQATLAMSSPKQSVSSVVRDPLRSLRLVVCLYHRVLQLLALLDSGLGYDLAFDLVFGLGLSSSSLRGRVEIFFDIFHRVLFDELAAALDIPACLAACLHDDVPGTGAIVA